MNIKKKHPRYQQYLEHRVKYLENECTSIGDLDLVHQGQP